MNPETFKADLFEANLNLELGIPEYSLYLADMQDHIDHGIL